MKRLYISVIGIICVAAAAPAFCAPSASVIVKHYEDMALAMYGETLSKAEALDKSVDDLRLNPMVIY